MFKKVFFILLFVLPFTIKAQSFIGLEAGYMGSNILFNPSFTSYKIHSGFTGGIHYTYQSKKRIVVFSGLRVQRYGFNYDLVLTDSQGDLIGEGRVQNRIMSLNIPLRAGYQLGNKVTVTPNIGLSCNAVLSANSILPKSLTGLGSLAKSTTFLQDLNTINLFAVIGTEVATSIQGTQVFGSIEYQHGLTNMTKKSLSAPGSSQRNLLLGITIGCRMPIPQRTDETGPVEIIED